MHSLLLQDINNALATLQRKHRVELKVEQAGPDLIQIRIGDSDRKTVEEEDYTKHAAGFGLDPATLNSTLVFGRKAYIIVGLKPSRPKYPVIVRRLDGKHMKMSVEDVNAALAKAKK